MDAAEIHLKRLNAKEVIFPKEKENLFFQSQMDESKPWRRLGPENIHLGTASTNSKRKVILTFLENQKGLFHNLKTHFRMPVKQLMTSRPCQEPYTAITLNPESRFTSPREESFPIALEYIDVSRAYSYEFGCQAREAH